MSLFSKKKESASEVKTASTETIKILDSAISLYYLECDLGLKAKPYESYNTIKPVENGYYQANGVLYQYKNKKLVEVENGNKNN